MYRRLVLLIAGAAVVLLAAAVPALAAGHSRSSDGASAPFGWVLQLRNARNAKRTEDMTYLAFRAFAKTKNREVTWTDTSDAANPVVYKGLPLYRLVGRIDDKDPLTFNAKLADKGYNVVIEAVDGFTVTWTSQEIKGRDDLIVADLANEAPIPLGSIKVKDDVASWKPTWPLKFVTGDANVFGNRKPGAIQRITIEPLAATASRADGTTAPYGWILQLRNAKRTKFKEDMTYRAFAAFAKTNSVTWTDTSDAANPVVYKGLPLYKLVGRIDDKDPKTFNTVIADKGYNVVIEAVDGFTVTWTSQEIKGRDDLIVANLANDAPIPLGTIKLKDGVYSWKPTWPLKFVTGDTTVFNNRKPGAIERITIEPLATTAAPF